MPFTYTRSSVCDAYVFGPFKMRVRTGVLLRNGKRIRVQELPLQMLLVLLENQGQLVSRQDLQTRLWGRGASVEVDSGLNVVAGKLREALLDRATDPTFVKTVPGQGYCFIGEVHQVFDSPAGALLEPTTESTPEPTPLTLIVETKAPKTNRRLLPIAGWSLLATVALSGACSYVYRYIHRPLVSDQDRVVVGGFSNNTGNSYFEGTLSSAVQLKLQESPYLSLIPDRSFRSLVKDPDSAPFQDELHACLSLDGQVLLKGKVLALAKGYQVLLMAWKCSDGHLLTTQEAEADSQAAILSALDLATEHMRRRLGESDSSLQKFNVPLMQATTGSLAALKAFTQGEKKRLQQMDLESIPDYKLAVDLDPQFALGYARLGTIYSNAGEPSLGRQYYQKAFDLRDRTTDRERLYIAAHYYDIATGEIERSIGTYELWRTVYPRDIVPANNLASAYLKIGQPQKAVVLARTAIQLDPAFELPYAMLAQAYLASGDYSNTRTLCNDPIRSRTNAVQFHQACFTLASVQNDEAGMQRQLDWAHGTTLDSALLDFAARTAMFRGKMSEARRLFSEARRSAFENNLVEPAAEIYLDQAVLEADIGFADEARKSAIAAMALAPNSTFIQAFVALVLARSGDTVSAQAEASKAAALSPLDTILNTTILASVRSSIQLQKHNSAAAIQSLESARPYDANFFMGLSPAYYRGLAYLQDHQWHEASKEFQSVVNHRAIDADSLYVALSQLELGRALQLSGDRANAARSYGDAETIWKDADPSFPPLQKLRRYQHELTPDPQLAPLN
jgi:eukaryotic-like serine/threonine-protein kinase